MSVLQRRAVRALVADTYSAPLALVGLSGTAGSTALEGGRELLPGGLSEVSRIAGSLNPAAWRPEPSGRARESRPAAAAGLGTTPATLGSVGSASCSSAALPAWCHLPTPDFPPFFGLPHHALLQVVDALARGIDMAGDACPLRDVRLRHVVRSVLLPPGGGVRVVAANANGEVRAAPGPASRAV